MKKNNHYSSSLKASAGYLGTILLATLLLLSCKRRNNELNMPGYELGAGEIPITEQAMGEIIQNVSSPVEIASLVKTIGVPYSPRYLSNLDAAESYGTSFRMAYSLGILGADLGYLNVYEKTGNAVSYLTAINRLADGLKVSQFFDFPTIKRLATSNTNIDSLMYLSVRSFNQMDDYLRQTDRSNLSALMVAGVWIEGMYLITQVAKEKPDKELAEYIGEQKINLNDMLVILRNYEKDDQFAGLIRDFEQIKKAFDEVNISYTMGDPKAVEQDGMLMVIQQEASIVEISDNTLGDIIQTTAMIRNKHLKNE